MPSNIIPEPQILVSSISWKIRLEDFLKKNRYFLIIALIVLLPVSVLLLKVNISTDTKLPIPSATPIPDNRLPCPITIDFCKNGKDVIAFKTYVGMGSTAIAKNTVVYAAFDGTLMTSKMISPKGETFWVVYLLNSQDKKEVAYWFKGTTTQVKNVKKGDIIATVSAEPLNDYQGNKFIFTKMDSTGKPVQLKPEDFK